MDNTHASPSVISEEAVLKSVGDVSLPDIGVIDQLWETDPIPREAIAGRATSALSSLELTDVPDGGTVAIGIGSRGIANLPTIVSGVVSAVADRGYDPFIFPAMGSHGGATAEGQREKLAALDVTEETVGCEIRATMDVIEIGHTPNHEVPVYADAEAAAADAIVPINRIKPHTDFEGRVESGLSKMLVIGMGKQAGAQIAHTSAVDWSFRQIIPAIVTVLLAELPIAGGVAVVEDEHDETTIVEGVPPEGFLDREAELLDVAYDRMPTLPFEELDALIVDAMGKDISGSGMDTNVIGRRDYGLNEPDPETPAIRRIYTRGLTDPSQGNSAGIGNADFIHRGLFEAIDWEKTVVNTLTASTPRGSRLPPAVETDRAGLYAMLATVGGTDTETVRLARIPDTMRLQRLCVSEVLVEEARTHDDLRIVREPQPLDFENGSLSPFP